jgi:hypothetical protein
MSAMQNKEAGLVEVDANTGTKLVIKTGFLGGMVGGVTIWIYEALVWVKAQHLLTLSGIPSNATGLVFGKHFQSVIGGWSYLLGTTIHFAFAILWGIAFAYTWPYFKRRGYEATFIALFYAVIAWVTMHVAISIVSSDHPNYLDPVVVIGGMLSHICYAVPMALVVKQQSAKNGLVEMATQ